MCLWNTLMQPPPTHHTLALLLLHPPNHPSPLPHSHPSTRPTDRQVNGRVIKKRIHVRVEHVQPSRCREDFLQRKERNDRLKHEAKKAGEKPPATKREQKGPRDGFSLTNVSMETITAIPYDVSGGVG